ncbi:MAG: T9SS type A sorting domain-containing protein [Fibrobacteraceae bacterium]|nr:T9SS type A sorting domain-containing protein [Fibrobacteraceae bacterium]
MNFLKASLFTAGLLAVTASASPNITIDGTAFKYKGNPIFFSGANLAWIDYNSDVGDNALDENAWRQAVEGVRSSGGNVIRWWLFNNMSQSPTINTTTHLVSGLKANTIANMEKALDIAEEYGVMVSMCLFSHNLMEFSQWGIYTNDKVDSTANLNLFTDEGTSAFITNALDPVVEAIGNHEALLTWEIFNEPEGMTSVGWTTRKIDKSLLQKFTNKVAAAIHAKNSALLVSTGSVNIQYQSWWNNDALIAAGGEATGTLDFFQTHYYPYYQNDDVSPFLHTPQELAATYNFDADKPLIIGEFPASGWAGTTYNSNMAAKTELTTEQCYQNAFDKGYAGVLAWTFRGTEKTETAFGGYTYTIDPALAAMNSLWNKDSSYIKIKDFTETADTGNGMMAVTYASNEKGTIEYQKDFDLSSANALTFTVKNNGAESVDIYVIFKMTSSWTWTETDGSCSIAAGESKTCSVDISGLTNRSVTKSILFANYSSYSGTLIFDNIAAGTDTLFNFNEDKYDAFTRASQTGSEESVLTEIKIVFNDPDYTAGIQTAQTMLKNNAMNYVHGTIELSLANNSNVNIFLFDMNGHKVATLYKGTLSRGTHSFAMSYIAKGLYIIRATGSFGTINKPMVIK